MTGTKTLSRALCALALIAATSVPYVDSPAAAAVDTCAWKNGPFHMDGAMEFPETTLGGLGQIWKPDDRPSDDAIAPPRYERHRGRHGDAATRAKERRDHARHHHTAPSDD